MIEASKKNMKEYHNAYSNGTYSSVYAYSPFTYEEYSANPNDYWDKPDDWVMKDSEGEPMALVVRAVTIIDLDDKELLKNHNYNVIIQESEQGVMK